MENIQVDSKEDPFRRVVMPNFCSIVYHPPCMVISKVIINPSCMILKMQSLDKGMHDNVNQTSDFGSLELVSCTQIYQNNSKYKMYITHTL